MYICLNYYYVLYYLPFPSSLLTLVPPPPPKYIDHYLLHHYGDGNVSVVLYLAPPPNINDYKFNVRILSEDKVILDEFERDTPVFIFNLTSNGTYTVQVATLNSCGQTSEKPTELVITLPGKIIIIMRMAVKLLLTVDVFFYSV